MCSLLTMCLAAVLPCVSSFRFHSPLFDRTTHRMVFRDSHPPKPPTDLSATESSIQITTSSFLPDQTTFTSTLPLPASTVQSQTTTTPPSTRPTPSPRPENLMPAIEPPPWKIPPSSVETVSTTTTSALEGATTTESGSSPPPLLPRRETKERVPTWLIWLSKNRHLSVIVFWCVCAVFVVLVTTCICLSVRLACCSSSVLPAVRADGGRETKKTKNGRRRACSSKEKKKKRSDIFSRARSDAVTYSVEIEPQSFELEAWNTRSRQGMSTFIQEV